MRLCIPDGVLGIGVLGIGVLGIGVLGNFGVLGSFVCLPIRSACMKSTRTATHELGPEPWRRPEHAREDACEDEARGRWAVRPRCAEG